MGAEEASALCSSLAERALCCGRGPVETKGDEAARQMLSGDVGALARRGAWMMLAARAGGLENEFFPPPPGEDGGAAASKKAAVAAAAPKAVAGCVRAMGVSIKSDAARAGRNVQAGGIVAGGGDARREVRHVCFCFGWGEVAQASGLRRGCGWYEHVRRGSAQGVASLRTPHVLAF